MTTLKPAADTAPGSQTLARGLTALQAVAATPEGLTIQQIADQIGRPKAVRATGAANGANPLSIYVPCHRIIGADGSLRDYGGGLEIKAALLALERAHAPMAAGQASV